MFFWLVVVVIVVNCHLYNSLIFILILLTRYIKCVKMYKTSTLYSMYATNVHTLHKQGNDIDTGFIHPQ